MLLRELACLNNLPISCLLADLVTTVRELSSLATVIVTPYLTDRAISKLRLDSRDVAMAISLICCLTRYKKGKVQCVQPKGVSLPSKQNIN